jgi:hypothetical protein
MRAFRSSLFVYVLALSALSALSPLAALPARAELLANDGWLSGQAVAFQGGFVAGETAAVRLVPTGPCPCQVDEVRFLFGGSTGTHDVILRIWDDSAGTAAPGAELYATTVSLTGSEDFLQTIDLRAAGVMVPGPFRVGLEFTHSGLPSVARDADGIVAGRNFIDESTFGWFDSILFGLTGDWVIRALVDSGTPGPGTVLSNDGWLSGQAVAFQGGFAAGETAAVRLVPPGPCPCRLDRVQFLFGGSGATHDVTLRVWDDAPGTLAPGALLYSTTISLTGSDEFLQEVDLSPVGLMVGGPIRIGLEFSHAGLPSVARDDDGIHPGSNFVDETSLGWVDSQSLGLTGDWIVRAVLDAAPGAQGSVLANDTWLPAQTAAFQGGFAAGETAAARFVPDGPCPCPLERVRFLFGGAPGTHDVVLRIWDDAALTDTPGTELYSATLALTGSDEFMQEVDIGVAGLTVTGPFRVGLEFTHAGLPSVARDTDGSITPARNFVDVSGPGWVQSTVVGLTGDWIIRAVLGGEAAGELVNNDTWVSGQQAGFQLGFAAGETAAARFVPDGPCPCDLDRIRFLFGGSSATETVILRVWDDSALTLAPGAELYSAAIQLTGTDAFLQELDLTVANISVNGPFRVGVEFQHSGAPSVARDADGTITPARNFAEVTGLGWVEASTLGITGDWVLRAVLDSVPGVLLAADSWVSAAPAAFGAGLVAGETAAVRLVPPGPCPCLLEDVRFLFGGGGDGQVVTLRIFEDSAQTTAPGALLYSQDVSLTPDDDVMQVVELHAAGIVVNGPFRVGVEQGHTGLPSVAVDDDGTTPGRSFVENGSGWSESADLGFLGDFIIRASLQASPTGVPALGGWGAAVLCAALVVTGAGGLLGRATRNPRAGRPRGRGREPV